MLVEEGKGSGDDRPARCSYIAIRSRALVLLLGWLALGVCSWDDERDVW